ncbi:MAG TPA: glycosyltransferase family 4 protein [Gemmatimonadaceae bacterium]|nr:glycosyltransferase family 4 protein [Gemmatimonadaceae bacterium]
MTIVLLTHAFPPDPAAVGQHMADLAGVLAKRGHRVVVITSDRGYDDASIRFARTETTPDGVQIHRLAQTSFGKATLFHRAIGIASFMAQSAVAAARMQNLEGIVYSTSPPFIGVIATVIGKLRGVPTAFWAMDLNPDQLVALGKLRPSSVLTRMMRAVNRFTLQRAAVVVALDQLMAARLAAQGAEADRLVVIPPWSPDEQLRAVPRAENAFRARYGLTDCIVVMYSGNHTQSNPLTTLLAAAEALRDVSHLKFVFVGGGNAKHEIEELISRGNLRNSLCLPYQPKSDLAASLSAADVHVVSLGAQMAGVIHPCKVYGAMAVGRPILYLGPSPSHVSAIIDECGNGWNVQHGNVDCAVTRLRRIAASRYDELDEIGARGRTLMNTRFQPAALVNTVANAIDRAFAIKSGAGL